MNKLLKITKTIILLILIVSILIIANNLETGRIEQIGL